MQEIAGGFPVLSTGAQNSENARAEELDQLGFGFPISSEDPLRQTGGFFSNTILHGEKPQLNTRLAIVRC